MIGPLQEAARGARRASVRQQRRLTQSPADSPPGVDVEQPLQVAGVIGLHPSLSPPSPLLLSGLVSAHVRGWTPRGSDRGRGRGLQTCGLEPLPGQRERTRPHRSLCRPSSGCETRRSERGPGRAARWGPVWGPALGRGWVSPALGTSSGSWRGGPVASVGRWRGPHCGAQPRGVWGPLPVCGDSRRR